jgi:hypothetical protein
MNEVKARRCQAICYEQENFPGEYSSSSSWIALRKRWVSGKIPRGRVRFTETSHWRCHRIFYHLQRNIFKPGYGLGRMVHKIVTLFRFQGKIQFLFPFFLFLLSFFLFLLSFFLFLLSFFLFLLSLFLFLLSFFSFLFSYFLFLFSFLFLLSSFLFLLSFFLFLLSFFSFLFSLFLFLF